MPLSPTVTTKDSATQIKGHSGHLGNDRADLLATKAISGTGSFANSGVYKGFHEKLEAELKVLGGLETARAIEVEQNSSVKERQENFHDEVNKILHKHNPVYEESVEAVQALASIFSWDGISEEAGKAEAARRARAARGRDNGDLCWG